MFYIKYRCLYRDFWYDGPEVYMYSEAIGRAQEIARQRKTPVAIFDERGNLVYKVGM